MRKQNQAAAAAAEVEKTKQLIAELTAQQAQLDAEAAAENAAIAAKWKTIAATVEQVDVAPRRTDIAVDLLAVAWTPEWVVEYDDGGITRDVLSDVLDDGERRQDALRAASGLVSRRAA